MEAFRLAAQMRFGAKSVDLTAPGNFEAEASFVELTDIGLAFAAINAGVVIEQPEAAYARLQIAVKGNAVTIAGSQTTRINSSQACMTSAGESSRMNWEAGHERLTVRIAQNALDRKLTALLGSKPKRNVEFEPALNMDHPHGRALRRKLLYVVQELDQAFADLPPLFVREMEQSLIVAALCATRHTFSRYLEDGVKGLLPRQVRLAEEYIEANWDQPMMVEALVTVTDASARSIFQSFREYRGYSPMTFLKLVRLRHAQRMLMTQDEDVSVSSVAFRCGFSNLGHFAKHYRERFGELPSQTLNRAKEANLEMSQGFRIDDHMVKRKIM
jgi:AraC-like DNA-binding protein